jgi:hypothetical protein
MSRIFSSFGCVAVDCVSLFARGSEIGVGGDDRSNAGSIHITASATDPVAKTVVSARLR